MTRLPTDEFAAFVGLDWAAAQHDVCLQTAGSETREFSVLVHTPEAIDEGVNTLRQRFKGQPIALFGEVVTTQLAGSVAHERRIERRQFGPDL